MSKHQQRFATIMDAETWRAANEICERIDALVPRPITPDVAESWRRAMLLFAGAMESRLHGLGNRDCALATKIAINVTIEIEPQFRAAIKKRLEESNGDNDA